jgi:hypothetical protein
MSMREGSELPRLAPRDQTTHVLLSWGPVFRPVLFD